MVQKEGDFGTWNRDSTEIRVHEIGIVEQPAFVNFNNVLLHQSARFIKVLSVLNLLS